MLVSHLAHAEPWQGGQHPEDCGTVRQKGFAVPRGSHTNWTAYEKEVTFDLFWFFYGDELF